MEILPELPLDIIVNILSRLPVKYLIQLKCVCKPWLSLISDPQFAKQHLAQSKKKNSKFSSLRVLLITEPLEFAICEASGDDLVDVSKLISELEYPVAMKKTPDFDEMVEGWIDLGMSCNGLICAVFDHDRIFLWNPTLREAKQLAKHRPLDPNSKCSYGLGYDVSTDDYKIVRVAPSSIANASNGTEVEVLKLRSNIWQKIQGLQTGIEIKGTGIFLHGALHWLAAKENGSRITYLIVAFDMTEEKFFQLVQIPKDLEDRNYYSMVLAISGDSLCLFCGCGYESVFEAWLLKDYGINSTWTRLFKVTREVLHGHKYWESPLCYTKTGKVLINYDGRELVWFDPKENTTTTFTPRNYWDWFHPTVYIESLVSPHCY